MPETIPFPAKTSGDPTPFPLARNPWLYPLLAAFLLAVLFGTRLLNDADMGFHLKSGQWIVQNHSLPTPDPFTYTRPGQEYLDMEWLYQIFLYLGFKWGGYSLLSLAHTALALFAFYLLWIRLRAAGASYEIALFTLVAGLLASESRFRVRPEVLTWVFLGLDLWILELRRNRRRDLLFLLPLLQLFWVNTEGLFFIGPVLMGISVLSSRLGPSGPDPKLLKYSVWSLVACLDNPYLLKGTLLPFSFLSTLGSSEIFKYTVQEFQPPWTFPQLPGTPVPSYLLAYKGFSIFLFLLLLATARRRKIHEWLTVLLFFSLSVLAVRNIPLFMIACAPLAVAAWGDLPWSWVRKFQQAFLSKTFMAFALTLFLAGFSARLATNAHYVSNRLSDRFGLGLDRDSLPVRACGFLSENHLDGKILNDLDDGDWLDWLGPQKTFMDGRLDVMGRDFFTQYVQSQAPGGLETLLAQYRPDIVFFNPLLVPQWALALRDQPDWRLVYLDSVNAVYLRKGYAPQIPPLDFKKLLGQSGVSPSILSEAPSLLQMPPPSPWANFGKDFIKPAEYSNGLLNLGIYSSYVGSPQASELFFLEAIRRCQGRYPDFYYNLGLLYASQGRREEAILCMRRVLRERPEDLMARRILGM